MDLELFLMLLGELITIAFIAGVWVTTVRTLQKRVDKLEVHNELQDKLISETHTTSQVILTKLDHLSVTLAEVREAQRKQNDE